MLLRTEIRFVCLVIDAAREGKKEKGKCNGKTRKIESRNPNTISIIYVKKARDPDI